MTWTQSVQLCGIDRKLGVDVKLAMLNTIFALKLCSDSHKLQNLHITANFLCFQKVCFECYLGMMKSKWIFSWNIIFRHFELFSPFYDTCVIIKTRTHTANIAFIKFRENNFNFFLFITPLIQTSVTLFWTRFSLVNQSLWPILSKNISSNQLFSDLFSKTVALTKFLL